MSVSEVLRRMLTEAGVEYVAEDDPSVGLHFTSWDAGGFMWEADDRDERIYLSADRLITPAQAIAATLGRGTCKVMRVNGFMEYIECSECGYRLFDSGWVDIREWNFCPKCGRRMGVDE